MRVEPAAAFGAGLVYHLLPAMAEGAARVVGIVGVNGYAVQDVKEKQLQQAILDCARRLGWLAYHVFDARRSTPGFPDCLLIRPPRLIVAELKTEKGRLSPFQVEWLERFRELDGVEVYVWRPTDWLSGVVEAILIGETIR